MRVYYLIFYFLFTWTKVSVGQNTNHIGVEASVTNDFTELTGNVTHLVQTSRIDYRLGLILRHDVSGFLSFEIGATYRQFHQGFNVKGSLVYKEPSVIKAYCVPLRLSTKINLRRDKIFFSPTMGLTLGFPSEKKTATYYGHFYNSGTDSVSLFTGTYYYNQKCFLLIQTGVSFDIVLKNNSSFSIFTSYYSGVQILSKTFVVYQENNYSPIYIEMFRKGSFWDVIGVSFRYPIQKT